VGGFVIKGANMDNNLTPLPPDYNTTEYAHIEILESGDVDIWLRRRGQLLIEKARDTARECEAGKLASIVVVGISAVMSANPLMWIPLGIGAGGYLWTIFAEFQDTGTIKPIPLYRGLLGNLLGILEGQQGEETHPLLEQIAYLPEQDKDEVLLLRYRFGQIAEVLGAVPPRTRFDLYRHIVEQYHARQILIEGDEIKAYLACAVSTARREIPAQQNKPALPIKPVEQTLKAQPTVSNRTTDPLPITQSAPITKHLPPFDRDRIINESKGLMVIGDMGAAKTCVAQYIANGFNGHGIIVFDPHGMTDWGNAYVLTKMGAIYEQMRILLDLLENGDTTPLLIICDEWLEIRGDRRNKKGSEYAGLADDFIRLFSTKPRKFNKLAAFVLHSPNVESAGVDSFLRENYLKIYLGRLAKKEWTNIKDCAYPCVLEDEQQEHPTHGHHTEFKPKGKAPRNLEPLQSAPINIPLAYMKGSSVEVCNRGWSDGQLRLEVESIRQRLEMLLDSSTLEPSPEPDSSAIQNLEPPKRDSEPLNQPTDEGCADLKDGSQFSSDDGKEWFTPLNLTKEQVLALIQNLNHELNQTQIIERLWQVKKGGSAAWKEAREQFKQLMGE
jgi:hypothetical protein